MNCNKLSTIPPLSLLIKYKDFHFSLCCLTSYWIFSVDQQLGQRPGLLDRAIQVFTVFSQLADIVLLYFYTMTFEMLSP